jgi:hypothetical protein
MTTARAWNCNTCQVVCMLQHCIVYLQLHTLLNTLCTAGTVSCFEVAATTEELSATLSPKSLLQTDLQQSSRAEVGTKAIYAMMSHKSVQCLQHINKAPLQLMECHLNQQMHSILRCAPSVLTPNKQYSILYPYHRALVYAVLVL